MKKRFKRRWREGFVDHTSWGKVVSIVDRTGNRVAQVDCYGGDESTLRMILDAPRMRDAILELAKGFESYGVTIRDLFGNDEPTMNAIREVEQIARNMKVGSKLKGDMG